LRLIEQAEFITLFKRWFKKCDKLDFTSYQCRNVVPLYSIFGLYA
jgi:hypothetical protein